MLLRVEERIFGVHALGQVFHFETSKNIPAIQYERALNALLPKDIRILKTEEMPDDFHARFSLCRQTL